MSCVICVVTAQVEEWFVECVICVCDSAGGGSGVECVFESAGGGAGVSV